MTNTLTTAALIEQAREFAKWKDHQYEKNLVSLLADALERMERGLENASKLFVERSSKKRRVVALAALAEENGFVVLWRTDMENAPPGELVLVKGDSGYVAQHEFITAAIYEPQCHLRDFWRDVFGDPLSCYGWKPTAWATI